MKTISKLLLTFSFLLFSAWLYTGCNVSDPVVMGNGLRLNLRGTILNGDNGEIVNAAVITMHYRERYEAGHQNYGELENIKISTGDAGLYFAEGTITRCRKEDTVGYIKAAATDSAGRYLNQTAAFKCTDKVQTINLVLQRTQGLRYLIIK